MSLWINRFVLLAELNGIRAIAVIDFSPAARALPEMHSIKRFIPAFFVVLWATGFIGARYAMPWAEPFAFLAIRFVLAAILFAGLTVLLGSRRASREEALHATVAGVLMHGV